MSFAKCTYVNEHFSFSFKCRHCHGFAVISRVKFRSTSTMFMKKPKIACLLLSTNIRDKHLHLLPYGLSGESPYANYSAIHALVVFAIPFRPLQF